MSWGARALSKPMEAFISSMISAGDMEKRPPHILLAVLSVTTVALSSLLQCCAAEDADASRRSQQPGPGRSGAIHRPVGGGRWPPSSGFASVYVTLGRPDNAGLPSRQARRTRRASRPGRPDGPGINRAEPGADGGLRLPQGARGAARDHVPGCRRAASARSPTGAARSCCSTCGRPGACPAARRCRRSTGCRPRWAPTSSRWWP